jgi:Zn-dependent protease
MGDFSSWSLNLGQWRGVRVRLHASFLLFGVLVLYVCTRASVAAPLSLSFGLLAILLVSVLIHELGHAYAAFRVGGSVDQVVLGPLGGLAAPHVPHEPLLELVTALAGPAASLLVCLLTAPVLSVFFAESPGSILFNPLEPTTDLTTGPGLVVVTLKLTLWVNWLLALVNLLPAFPFDGGRALRALFWRAFDFRTSVLIVAYYAKLVAIGLAIIAFWKYKEILTPVAGSLLPAGIPMLILAILLYFSAQQESNRLEQSEADESLDAYDFSQGYTSLERTFEPPHRGPGPLRRWLAHRRETRRVRELQQEREEEAQFDIILARIHEIGMEGLSAPERALLERVSARYRNRQQS